MTTISARKPKPRPTISDVARLAKVSISTVSRVVNDTAPVSVDVVQRVRGAIDMLDYSPYLAARNLAIRKTNTIGLLLPELSNAFFSPLLRGIEAAVRQTDFDLLVYVTPNMARHGWRSPIGEHNTDGMIIFSNILDDTIIERNYQRSFPMVLLHRHAPLGAPTPVILFENRPGMRRLIDHLIEVHGRRRIAFLQGPLGNQDSEEREQGYREALAAHAIVFDASLVGSRLFRGGWWAGGRRRDAAQPC